MVTLQSTLDSLNNPSASSAVDEPAQCERNKNILKRKQERQGQRQSNKTAMEPATPSDYSRIHSLAGAMHARRSIWESLIFCDTAHLALLKGSFFLTCSKSTCYQSSNDGTIWETVDGKMVDVQYQQEPWRPCPLQMDEEDTSHSVTKRRVRWFGCATQRHWYGLIFLWESPKYLH